LPSQIILLEHFIYGPFPNHGYRFIKTSHIYDQISDQELLEICQQGGGIKKPTIITKCPNATIPISLLVPVTDESERKGMWNHTILIKLGDLLKLIDLSKLLEPYFIHPLDKPPDKFEPIQIGKVT